ncbi:uncharacterized protein LOC120177176 [Hibiscus syriacus]|uniref:uncharacterized protein LOC120177176 n=1 Tax=Hibiscus syriacus TaxID=106335 RepID=UPI00192371C7|nr:uncharacterized protein LOC120177176 [Hibiscus syriacus]
MGSIIPNLLTEYMMGVANGGDRRSFVLNNVIIISPNICTSGSIRCHGIDGMLSPVSNVSLHACFNGGSSVAPPSSLVDSLPPLPPLADSFLTPDIVDEFMVPALQPSESSSGFSQFSWDGEVIKVMISTLVPLVIGVSM